MRIDMLHRSDFKVIYPHMLKSVTAAVASRANVASRFSYIDYATAQAIHDSRQREPEAYARVHSIHLSALCLQLVFTATLLFHQVKLVSHQYIPRPEYAPRIPEELPADSQTTAPRADPLLPFPFLSTYSQGQIVMQCPP
jgi:hypothetical protein